MDPKKRFLTRKERTQNIINNSKLINHFLKSAIQRSNEEPEIINNSKIERLKKMPVNYIPQLENRIFYFASYYSIFYIVLKLYSISLC
jgi:hypothetical protein